MTVVASFETIMSRNNTTLQEMDSCRPAKTSKFNLHMSLLATVLTVTLCLCLVSSAGAASIQKRRAIASATESMNSGPTKECQQNSPCGWAIYIPFTRRIDYFMKNTCVCNDNLACVKTDDDLSVNAYVYRCKTRPLTTTDNAPTTTEFMSADN